MPKSMSVAPVRVEQDVAWMHITMPSAPWPWSVAYAASTASASARRPASSSSEARIEQAGPSTPFGSARNGLSPSLLAASSLGAASPSRCLRIAASCASDGPIACSHPGRASLTAAQPPPAALAQVDLGVDEDVDAAQRCAGRLHCRRARTTSANRQRQRRAGRHEQPGVDEAARQRRDGLLERRSRIRALLGAQSDDSDPTNRARLAKAARRRPSARRRCSTACGSAGG